MRIQESKIELQKKVHRGICVRDITFLTARSPSYIIFCCFFCVLHSWVEKKFAREKRSCCKLLKPSRSGVKFISRMVIEIGDRIAIHISCSVDTRASFHQIYKKASSSESLFQQNCRPIAYNFIKKTWFYRKPPGDCFWKKTPKILVIEFQTLISVIF